MKFYTIPFRLLWLTALLTGLAGCDENHSEPPNKQTETVVASESVKLDVYKSPTCGCCADWVEHIEAAGFGTLVHHPGDLASIKQQHGIDSDMQSCHTAVTRNGYVFEGHIPADIMQRFLDNPPENAIGLAVPGMPIGSPGMEMGDRYDDYAVMLIKQDGSVQVYEEVKGARHHD